MPDARLRRYLTGSIAGMLALFTGTTAMAGQEQTQDECSTTSEIHVGAPVAITAWSINGNVSSYSQDGQFIPEVVALGVFGTDEDAALLRCNTQCTRVDFAVPVGVMWTIPGSAADNGHFVGPQGEPLHPSYYGSLAAYQPPRNLAEGEVREFFIQAEVTDALACDGAPPASHALDPPATVEFKVRVHRTASPGLPHGFHVTIQHESTEVPKPVTVDCNSTPTDCCTFGGSSFQLATPITTSLDLGGYPHHGMLSHDRRTVSICANDLDSILWECGYPGCGPAGPDTPLSLRDTLTYTWTVEPTSAPIDIIASGAAASSIVVQTGDTSGLAQIRVTIDDGPGGDSPATVLIEFPIYRVRALSQDNGTEIPERMWFPGAPGYRDRQVAFAVSQKRPLIEGFNASEAPVTAQDVFDGDVPAAERDWATYRFEADGGGHGASQLALNIRRSYATLDGSATPQVLSHDPSESYRRVLVESNDVHRTATDTRLVSNAEPSGALTPASYRYDADPDYNFPSVTNPSEISNILVGLGDWLTVELVKVQPGTPPIDCVIGHFSAPVGRVWGESDFPAYTAQHDEAVGQTALTLPIEFSATNGTMFPAWSTWASTKTSQGSWNASSADFHVARLTEDYAQAGFIFHDPQNNQVTPSRNCFFVSSVEPGAPIDVDITVKLTEPATGVQHTVAWNYTGPGNAVDLADSVAQKIDGLNIPNLSITLHRAPYGLTGVGATHRQASGLIIALSTSSASEDFNPSATWVGDSWDQGVVGLDPFRHDPAAGFFLPQWTRGECRAWMAGLHADRAPLNAISINVFPSNTARPEGTAGFPQVTPFAGFWYNAAPVMPDPSGYRIAVFDFYAFGDDTFFPMVIGHEVMHHLHIGGTHSLDPYNIFNKNLTTFESAAATKRMSPAQIATIRRDPNIAGFTFPTPLFQPIPSPIDTL